LSTLAALALKIGDPKQSLWLTYRWQFDVGNIINDNENSLNDSGADVPVFSHSNALNEGRVVNILEGK
jgi:hypothetical protein